MHPSRNLQIGSPKLYHTSMFASMNLSNVNPFCCPRCPRAVFTLWKRLLVSKCLCHRSVSCSCSASVYPYPISLQSFLLQAEESCLISSLLVCKLLPQSHLCCSVHWCINLLYKMEGPKQCAEFRIRACCRRMQCHSVTLLLPIMVSVPFLITPEILFAFSLVLLSTLWKLCFHKAIYGDFKVFPNQAKLI